MRTEMQIERIAQREGQATKAQDRVELTETELTHLVGGSIDLGSAGSEVDLKSVPILM